MSRKKMDIVIGAVDDTKGLVKKLDRDVGDLAGTFFNLKSAVAAAGVGFLAHQFVNASSTAEGFKIRLNAVLGSVSEGNRLFNEMASFAGTVSYEYENIMASATQLAGVMKGGVDEVSEWMPLIADLAAVSGLSIEDTTSQVVRMYSAGAASADLFRERGILSMLDFQAGVSYSAEETRDQLIAAWEDPASKFKDAAFEMADTWDGLWSMQADRWFQFRTTVMDAGPFEFLKGWLKILHNYMNVNEDKGRELAGVLGNELTEVLASVATGAGNVAQGFAIVQLVINSLKVDFYTLQEGLWKTLHALRETNVKMREFFGQDTGEGYEDAVRIMQEQEIILAQIAKDKEAALAAGAKSLELYDNLSANVGRYKEEIQQLLATVTSGAGEGSMTDPLGNPVQDPVDAPGSSNGNEEDKEAERLAGRLARLDESLMSERELIQSDYWEKHAILQEALMQEFLTKEEFTLMELALEEQRQQRLTELADEGTKSRKAFEEAEWHGKLSIMTKGMIKMTQGAAQQNEAMFRINQAARIVEASQEAVKGAITTWNSYPYPWNIPMTALHIAGSAAYMDSLMGASPPSKGTTVGGYGSGTPESPVVTQPEKEEQKASMTVIINGNVLGEDEYIEERLAPRLLELQSRDVEY